jgi:hypothetical protein
LIDRFRQRQREQNGANVYEAGNVKDKVIVDRPRSIGVLNAPSKQEATAERSDNARDSDGGMTDAIERGALVGESTNCW